MLNIRPSIELCCPVVLDLSCNGLFRFFFFVLFVFFVLLLPLMANKVCMCYAVSSIKHASQPSDESRQSPTPLRDARGHLLFVNISVCWHPAHKILTYWFCDTFKNV